MVQKAKRERRSLKIHKGYTLVEVLVVLFIVALVAGIAVLTVSHNEEKQITAFIDEFTEAFALAKEKARFEGETIDLVANDQHYQFLSLPGSHWAGHLPNAWHMTGRPSKITVAADGTVTPFKLTIGKNHDRPRYVITGSANGEITRHAA